MRVVCIDFETYFDKEFTLSKMTTEAYVRDPKRFEAHGAAVKWSKDHDAKWYDAPTLARILRDEDWSDTAIICHHAQFDGLILSHWLGIRPKLWICTLSMGRMLLGNHISVSLDSLRKLYGMPPKTTPYTEFIGKHWRDMPDDLRQRLADGCCDEVESIWKIFGELAKEFPACEYETIDITVRMFVEPVLRADVPLLRQVWTNEERRKVALRQAINVSEDELQSADKFCAILEDYGIDAEYKRGKDNADGSPRWIPALAKTDDFMRELLEHEDEFIRALAEARIGAKSTLLQSRAEHLGHMASRGPLCVYLRYCGAHTTRWSGGDSSNFQNFKRGSDIRRALLAPDGYLILVIDLSQTECRLVNYLAGQWDVIERFKAGADPYVGIASAFYGRPITKSDEAERGTGKQAELSCGFGCGPPKFRRTAALGIYGPPVKLTDDEAERAVRLYRDTHRNVTEYWHEAANMLPWINGKLEREWGPFQIKNSKLYLPNGTRINYDAMEWDAGVDEKGYTVGWKLKTRKGFSKMYGAKLVENIVQAGARVIMSDAMIRLNRAGFRPIMTAHDDVAVLIPKDDHVQERIDFCVNEVKRTPAWLPGIPLDAEYEIGERYEK